MPNQFSGSLYDHIQCYIGETVTIFTTSGGQSGFGFTGVLLGVNGCFVRLVDRVGPAPGCALGNGCSRGLLNSNNNNSRCCCNVGAVTDIPVDKIAAFVHNAV